jgi:HAD superfamily hydrolase (TIGR01509 family)
MKALIFDCDGVLVDTERDGHRVAFNRSFRKKGLAVEWDVALYGELLKIAGGKERMRHYFDESGWPVGVVDKDSFIRELHNFKTGLFMEIIESGQLPLRPGVQRIVDEAIANDVMLGVCSTSNEKAVNLIVEKLLGLERKERFLAILAGDVVARKKPDPEIYNLARETLKLNAKECVVIEDSRNGLLAAKAAGMCCVITTNGYTENEDFTEADDVYAELGDGPAACVTLDYLKSKFINGGTG